LYLLHCIKGKKILFTLNPSIVTVSCITISISYFHLRKWKWKKPSKVCDMKYFILNSLHLIAIYCDWLTQKDKDLFLLHSRSFIRIRMKSTKYFGWLGIESRPLVLSMDACNFSICSSHISCHVISCHIKSNRLTLRSQNRDYKMQ
jgi:hypothetical protein